MSETEAKIEENPTHHEGETADFQQGKENEKTVRGRRSDCEDTDSPGIQLVWGGAQQDVEMGEEGREVLTY